MRRRVRTEVAVVLLDTGARGGRKRAEDILRLTAKGDKELAVGKGHSLENVLKDAHRILAS